MTPQRPTMWRAGPWIELGQQRDRSWRWVYRDAAEDLSLRSNESYLSLEAAADAARTAYPGVSLWKRPQEPSWRLHPSLKWLAGMLGVATVAAILVLLLVTGGAAVGLLLRRGLRFRRRRASG